MDNIYLIQNIRSEFFDVMNKYDLTAQKTSVYSSNITFDFISHVRE